MRKNSKERITTSILKKIITFFLILIFLAIQLFLYYELLFGVYFNNQKVWFWIVYFACLFLGCIVIASFYNKNINTSYKLTWTILILLFPFFGTFCYFLYGNGRSMPRRKNKKIRAYLLNRISKTRTKDLYLNKDQVGYNLLKGLEASTGFTCYTNTEVTFYANIRDKHLRFLEDLKAAKKYIFMEFFIVSEGKLLNQLYEILLQKGQEGIPIYFIYDDVGSKATLHSKTIKKLQSIPNLLLKAYAPFGQNMNPAINYRDHRKIVVIDGKIAYCGGDNLADEYIHEKVRFGYWRDNALRLYGEGVHGFVYLFLEMWYMSSKERLIPEEFLYDFSQHVPPIQNDSIVMPFGDGPTYQSHPSYNLFINMITSAQKSIRISTPYFIIDKEFINALCRAARNGVEVEILVPAIPDKKMVFYMTRGHYENVLQAGGKIYEYTPGFNHAKNVIIDSKYAFVGTTNTDYRSFFLHFECGTFLMHDKSIVDMNKDFTDAIKQSNEISLESWKNRPLYQKFIEFLLTFLSPLL